MSTETYTTMRIGGALPRNLINELNGRIDEEFFGRTDDCRDINAVAEAGDRLVISGFTGWANADALVAFCVDHDLQYHLSWEGDTDGDAGAQYWNPSMEKPVELNADSDGEPVITLVDLEKAFAGEETIEQVVERMRPGSADRVPPLTITEAIDPENPPFDDDPSHGERVEIGSLKLDTQARIVNGYLKYCLAASIAPLTLDDVQRCTKIIDGCQADLKRQLSHGECRDLLADNTEFSMDQIRDLVRLIVGDDASHEPSPPVDDGSCDPLYGQRMDSADMGEN